MRVGLGPRFLIEAVFLVAVAIVAGVERLRTIVIVALMAAAWILVAVFEFAWARLRAAHSRPAAATAEPAPPPPAEAVAAEAPAPAEEPHPAPEAAPAPVEEPSPVAEAEPAPDEVPPRPPVLAAVPSPEPEPPSPQPEPEPDVEPPPPEPPPAVVALPDRSPGPRRWNLWDLERLARPPTGDTARDEERSYLLLYLREFAGPDGLLPPDFDAVVREAFGDVLDPAYS